MLTKGTLTRTPASGSCTPTGDGVPEDDSEAVRWFRLAADQGDAEAQYCLGIMYRNGDGVPQDYAEAVRWLRLAADQGVALAQAILGIMYRKGEGVPQDYAEAARWSRLAADQGLAPAQGIDVPDDELPLRLRGQHGEHCDRQQRK